MKKLNFALFLPAILSGLMMLCSTLVFGQTVDTLINVGKYKLHFNITKGRGVPIVFESGAGNDGSVWRDIVKPLYDSLHTTLITYDREGFGKSEIDTTNINIVEEVKGLETALIKLGFTNKLFFVAHSLGGNYTMIFHQRNKGKVIGGVLIDIPTPCFMTDKKAKEIYLLFRDSLEVIKRESLGFYYIARNYEFTSKKMREASRSLKIPLTVICSDTTPFPGSESIIWKNCLKGFGSEYKNRRFIMAPKTGHYVFYDNPSLVIKAIINQYKKYTPESARHSALRTQRNKGVQ